MKGSGLALSGRLTASSSPKERALGKEVSLYIDA